MRQKSDAGSSGAVSGNRYCRCCHRILGVDREDDWCKPCAKAVREDIGRLQNLPPAQLVSLSDIFATCGALALARAMVAGLPFDDGVRR